MRLATRGSPLALWQAEHVAGLVRAVRPGAEVDLVVVDTTGDRISDRPVWELSGQGVFVKEVQAAVLDGRADAAVHSAKDLPSLTAPGLALAAVPARADARDVLVSDPGLAPGLEGLGPAAPVATGSVRRRAQLAYLRPDLTFSGLRGNIATRLDRIPHGGAIVMAAAALARLGLKPSVTAVLDPSVMLPQVAQGAIAVECRSDDPSTEELLAAVDDSVAHAAVVSERSFLARIGGGCDLPVGANATLSGDGAIAVEGLIASLDGRVVLRASRSGPVAESAALGAAVAGHLLSVGGSQLLADSGCAAP